MNKGTSLRLTIFMVALLLSLWRLNPRHSREVTIPPGSAPLEVLSPAKGWTSTRYTLRCVGGGGKVGEAPEITLRLEDEAGNILKDNIPVGAGYTPGQRIDNLGPGVPHFNLQGGRIEKGAEYHIDFEVDYMNLGLDLVGGSEIVYEVPKETQAQMKSQTMDLPELISLFREKINAKGLKEIYVQGLGTDRILVQLPGLRKAEVENIKNVLETQGQLEFKLVNDNPEDVKKAKEYVSRGLELPRANFPYKLAYFKKKGAHGNWMDDESRFELVEAEASVTGTDITHAKRDIDTKGLSGGYSVDITFSIAGAKRFGRLTEKNVGKRLAIVLDGGLKSDPVLREPIRDGRCQITGQFTKEDADNLVAVLRSGSMNVKPRLLSENVVGPTLGGEAIRSGIQACLLGAGMVFTFALIYYRLLGAFACFALFMNVAMLAASMSLFGGTLTLPGIAGYALTIGMAVDASVLIFERLREEMEKKQPLKKALGASFDRAFITIFDSNFTTFITAFILYFVGSSGPVKGFCLSLMVGLAINIFTAVYVKQTLLFWCVNKGWIKGFTMMDSFARYRDVNFFKYQFLIRLVFSYGVIGLGMACFFIRGGSMLDVDFKSGLLLQVNLTRSLTAAEVETAIEPACKEAGVKAQVQSFGKGGTSYVLRMPELQKPEKDALLQKLKGIADPDPAKSKPGLLPLPDRHDLAFPRDFTIGSVAATEVFLWSGGALVLSMIAIALYVLMRFSELKYGVAACLALGHDVLITLGALALFGYSINLTVFAAILTVVGYSINDTIVIFDRIRENIGKQKNYDLQAIAFKSVNQTLGRTTLTVLTTLFVVLALLILGGGVMNDFAFTMLVGITTGFYSTIFIAVPFAVYMHSREKQQAPAATPAAGSAAPPSHSPATTA